MAYQTTEQSKFNMAQATLERLNNTLTRAFNYYIKGNIVMMYFELKSLKLQIIAKLKPNEREELLEMENRIEYLYKNKSKINILISIPLVERYNIRLQDLMESKGLLLINKEDETIFS